MEDDYIACHDFSVIYQDLLDGNCRKYIDFVLHDGYSFRGAKLYIPFASLYDFLIPKLHASRLAYHLVRDKTIALVKDRFYWPSLKWDVGGL